MNNQVQRVVTAAVGIPLALGAAWYGGLVLTAVIALFALQGTRELFGLAEKAGVRPLRRLGLTLAVLAPLLTWVVAGPLSDTVDPLESLVGAVLGPLWLWIPWPLAALLVPLLVLSGVLLRRTPEQRPLAAAAVTLFGPLYCGLLLSAVLLIRFGAGPDHSWAATWLVFFPLAVTWLCDSFAMWGGKAIGGAKLWPSVSPGKTRSGAVAGLVGGVITAIVYAQFVLTAVGKPLPLWQAAIMGLVISLVAQLGDLVESLFKREAGVKDAGTLMPGHGGILDRLDALYFVLPVAAVLFRGFGVL